MTMKRLFYLKNIAVLSSTKNKEVIKYMELGTNLQEVYDRLQSKLDEDLNGQEARIFNVLISAIARLNRDIASNLDYVLDAPEYPGDEVYSGSFVNSITNEEIELLALGMYYEWNRIRQQKLLGQKTKIGTKDFNRIEDAKHKLSEIRRTLEQIDEDIEAFKNSMYTYKYE